LSFGGTTEIMEEIIGRSLTPNLSRTSLGKATNRPSRFSGQPAVAWYTALAMAADMPATSRPLFIASLREFRSGIAPSWPVGLVEARLPGQYDLPLQTGGQPACLA
jgi:hypothetical protein